MIRKSIPFVILFLLNAWVLSAQTSIDTIITVHDYSKFPGYDSQTQQMVVFNDEFNPSTQKWIVAIDIYGRISESDVNQFKVLKKEIHFDKLYKKEVLAGKWVKGDSVKNGYWIQYDYNFSKIREGFVVNGLKENKWIEYDDEQKIGEGNYLQGKREGVWKEWQYSYNSKHDNVIYSEKIGKYKGGLKQGEWLDYPFSIKTGEKASICRKILYLNDTLTGNYNKAFVLKYTKKTAACTACNLVEENLIYISVRTIRRGRVIENMDQLLLLLDSLGLDLYSDKVLRTYTDKNGMNRILTVREHNQYVLSGQWWKKMGGGEGPVVPRNTLVVEKKQGRLDGFKDKILGKLRESKLIVGALPLCTYTLGPDPLLETISVINLSADDEATILKALKISPERSKYSESSTYSSYYIEALSGEEIEKLFELLCKSNSVTKIYCAQGYIVNH